MFVAYCSSDSRLTRLSPHVHFWKIEVSNIVISEGHVRSPLPSRLVYEKEEEENRVRLGIAGGKVNYGVWREGEGADRHWLLMPNE